ncbi:Gfo/Idh/MocA family protein [Microlunatus sp. Gsoil 973]|uniref:Gfo/Idh/MocA family protein n=1 Tax=Microlunatus sp. Gsoil 973 TaxID=2672569 RepID=UPI0012B4AF2F|nr:Gfo/Idh/MocA family oxidoreductase [Microlunatus sp. Gsoil 973]QGN34232.1 gfo/Idh/MocA family oxidoreductase [Microlunatus sp. Gsoil 973]
MNNEQPVRIIQVGAGGMGRAWLGAIGRSPDAELVGLVDIAPGAAEAALESTRTPSVPTATSLPELLRRVEADAVVNVTIPEAHVDVSISALSAGLPVLCEKPAAENTAAALSMAAAAEVSGRLMMISQSRRYYGHVVALGELITRIGGAGLVECSFYKAPHFGGFRDQMDYPLLIDMAIHQFDLARLLIGSDPVSIFCESFNPDWSWYAGDAAAQVSTVFDGGTRFAFTGSWCSPGLETSWNGDWRISGPNGTARWDGDHAPTAETAEGQPIPVTVPDLPAEINGSLAEFITALRGGPVPDGEVHSNILSLLMVEAAVRSARSGQREKLAGLLQEAYEVAVQSEQRPAVRAALAGWSSVHDLIGRPYHGVTTDAGV